MVNQLQFGSLQAAIPLDKERGLALLTGQLLLVMLDIALPVKVLVLQQLQAQGRSLRSNQREEPDDLQLARQEIEGLLQQIQPEPYKFYERWEFLLSTERGSRRTTSVINDLWRHLPELVRLTPEGAGELRRLTGLFQESRGLCIKLQQDRHHASHSKADTTFHSLSWHATVLRLAEMPEELKNSAQLIIQTAITLPNSLQSGLEQSIQLLCDIETHPLLDHIERSFVHLACGRTALSERWMQLHPQTTKNEPVLANEELSQLREELAILQDRFSALSSAIGPVLNRLGDDISSIAIQLRELMVAQAEAHMAIRQSKVETVIDNTTALSSVRAAYKQLQGLSIFIVQEMGQLEPDFRFYHCIIYRELIVQAMRQRVLRVEQLMEISRQTILQKTLRSGGNTNFASRMVDEQGERFSQRIQVILDKVIYPSIPINKYDLLDNEQ